MNYSIKSFFITIGIILTLLTLMLIYLLDGINDLRRDLASTQKVQTRLFKQTPGVKNSPQTLVKFALIEQKMHMLGRSMSSKFQKVFFLVLITFFLFIYTIYIIRVKVLKPIYTLTDLIFDFKHGKKGMQLPPVYNDEIGAMTKYFFSMKKSVEHNFSNMEVLASIDPLTGVKNRRAFFEISEQILEKSKQEKLPVTLFMLDIDHFKAVNDTYGHLIGDEILKHLVITINTILDEDAIFARYGGEEFICLLPNHKVKTALEIAQNICSTIANEAFVFEDLSLRITVSIGLYEYKDENLIRELILKADEALYDAKDAGRNRVIVNF